MRNPTYLSSNTHPASSKGASVRDASIGCRRLGSVDVRLTGPHPFHKGCGRWRNNEVRRRERSRRAAQVRVYLFARSFFKPPKSLSIRYQPEVRTRGSLASSRQFGTAVPRPLADPARNLFHSAVIAYSSFWRGRYMFSGYIFDV